MNPTHIHLIVTHLPIYGIFLGIIVLLFGMVKNSASAISAAYLVMLIAVVGGVIAYLTGEPAEDTVRNIAGISKETIEEHEESATWALVSLIITAVSSAVGLVLIMRSSRIIVRFSLLVLIISVLTFAIAARTGYLGGKIRHTELNNTSATLESK